MLIYYLSCTKTIRLTLSKPKNIKLFLLPPVSGSSNPASGTDLLDKVKKILQERNRLESLDDEPPETEDGGNKDASAGPNNGDRIVDLIRQFRQESNLKIEPNIKIKETGTVPVERTKVKKQTPERTEKQWNQFLKWKRNKKRRKRLRKRILKDVLRELGLADHSRSTPGFGETELKEGEEERTETSLDFVSSSTRLSSE